jgi:hypothetical protein
MARWSWFPMLKKRGKWWSYRKAVPRHLRPLFGGKYEIVVSLKTQDEGVACLRVLEVALDTEKAIQRARECACHPTEPAGSRVEDFQSSVEDTKASGLVARAIEKTGARGFSVTAPAK